MNFEDHIKKLSSELDLSSCNNEDKAKEIFEDAQEMKDLINQQKKKAKKRKRNIEFTEETDFFNYLSLLKINSHDNFMCTSSF